MVNARNSIYCPIRMSWVASLPEEEVRQHLMHRMVSQLGYPQECFAIERALQQMPHLLSVKKELPARRADLVCFAKGIHPDFELYPLLLVECKAVSISPMAVRQIVGYNYYLQAYFIAIANHEEVRTGWMAANEKEYGFVEGLPHYQHLLQLCHTLPKNVNIDIATA